MQSPASKIQPTKCLHISYITLFTTEFYKSQLCTAEQGYRTCLMTEVLVTTSSVMRDHTLS